MPKPDFSDVPDPKKLDPSKEVEPKYDDMDVLPLPPIPTDQPQTPRQSRQISQSEAFGDGFEFDADAVKPKPKPTLPDLDEAVELIKDPDKVVRDNKPEPEPPPITQSQDQVLAAILEELKKISETIDRVSVALLEDRRGLG